MRQLAVVSEFVRAHEMRWAPPGEQEQTYWKYSYVQHTDDDVFAFIAHARLDYRDEPAIQTHLTRARTWLANGRAEAPVRSTA